jgi:hypothetical protein
MELISELTGERVVEVIDLIDRVTDSGLFPDERERFRTEIVHGFWKGWDEFTAWTDANRSATHQTVVPAGLVTVLFDLLVTLLYDLDKAGIF